MCCPASEKTILFFKTIEPLFWFAQGLVILNLIFPKVCFVTQLNWLNKLFKYQGFDCQVSFTEKAYKIWYRDLCILFFLIPLVIALIHLL